MSNIESSNSLSNIEPSEFKNRLVSEENFELLRNAQKKIFEATEVTPSLRKIVNMVINRETIERVTNQIIQTLKE
ncbi:MAG: hypothetical protein K0S08_684 [Gammaproteobacteria bacterium]|jgi:hypothetical protein|nr:hypothetical protein [Gammaproteobacteria bacterium]